MSVSKRPSLLLFTLSLAAAPGCAAEAPTQAEVLPQQLPGGVQIVASAMGTEGDALKGTGTLRFPWSSASRDVSYEVTGTPAAVPEVYEVRTREAETGASANLVFRPEQGTVDIEVPGHEATVQHNPDGSYSMAGQAYASLQDAAAALVKDAAMASLSAELLVTATVGLGMATRTAGTRVPDGYCDPRWFEIDPDCHWGLHGLSQTYTCERWGEGSEGCGFYQSYEP